MPSVGQDAPAGGDRIELRGLRVVGTHGLLPEERTRAQPFEVDLDLDVDLRPAGDSDRLADTVDYGAVAAAVERTLAGPRSFGLLEGLVAHVAAAVLQVDPADHRGDGGPAQAPATPGPGHRQRGGASGPQPVTSPPAGESPRRAFVSLGSNVGDRLAHLRTAVDLLRAEGDPPVSAVSQVYETEPVGGPDQGQYLNLVLELTVAPGTDPYRLLEQCQRLEAAAGRVRDVRWGPRTLDADLIWIDGVVLDDPKLTLPHPRWRERRFVLAPLAELAPDLADAAAVASAGGEVRVVGML